MVFLLSWDTSTGALQVSLMRTAIPALRICSIALTNTPFLPATPFHTGSLSPESKGSHTFHAFGTPQTTNYCTMNPCIEKVISLNATSIHFLAHGHVQASFGSLRTSMEELKRFTQLQPKSYSSSASRSLSRSKNRSSRFRAIASLLCFWQFTR